MIRGCSRLGVLLAMGLLAGSAAAQTPPTLAGRWTLTASWCSTDDFGGMDCFENEELVIDVSQDGTRLSGSFAVGSSPPACTTSCTPALPGCAEQWSLDGTVEGQSVDFTLTMTQVIRVACDCGFFTGRAASMHHFRGTIVPGSRAISGSFDGQDTLECTGNEECFGLLDCFDSTSSGTFSVDVDCAPYCEMRYYGLGDSVASGYGLDGQSSDECHRAPDAYPNQVDALLAEATSYATVVSRHFACSGARAVVERLEDPPERDILKQVQQALLDLRSARAKESSTAIVSMTIGANDFSWTDAKVFPAYLCAPSKNFKLRKRRIIGVVQGRLRQAVDLLVAEGDVYIVLTEYHNPFNMESVLFAAMKNPTFGGTVPYLPQYYRKRCKKLSDRQMYLRIEKTIRDVNRAFEKIARAHPGLVGVARIHDTFRGHESSAPSCGRHPTEQQPTWIQLPSDGVPFFNGNDCFHPNRAGAAAFADAVRAVAVDVLTFAQKPRGSSRPAIDGPRHVRRPRT